VQAKGIHHLGVAVEDLDEAVETYRRLFGAEVESRDLVETQGVEAAAVRVGESRVELVAPLGDDTPVGKFLANRGQGMHHVAYAVTDLRRELADLAEQGVHVIDQEPHRGLFGLEVAFIHPDSAHGVLVELVASG
jgi:methylmalonyl-CoA/ethylmalonyl-CoA epimerase